MIDQYEHDGIIDGFSHDTNLNIDELDFEDLYLMPDDDLRSLAKEYIGVSDREALIVAIQQMRMDYWQ